MPRFITLYSGSSGNCAAVQSDEGFLLVDMGASCKATLAAMVQVGLSPALLRGILITHEHVDHIRGLRVFLKKVKVPVFGTAGTVQALWGQEAVPDTAELVALGEEDSVELGGFLVRLFCTSHDAAACCGWRLQAKNGSTMAIATDLGCMTPEVYSHLKVCAWRRWRPTTTPRCCAGGRTPRT